jgi:creatinine amidohydrolase
MKLLFILSVSLLSTLAPLRVGAAEENRGGRELRLEELSYTDVEKLDRQKTIFILTFGIMEEHGPVLPIGTDWIPNLAIRDRLSQHLRSVSPDCDVVLVEPLPLGEAGANDIAGRFEHPGSFTVRFETLRAVALDLGATIARKGFQNILIVADHGMPLHSEAFNEASDFVSERYHVRMVPLFSFVEAERDYVGERGNVKDTDVDWSDPIEQKYLGQGWDRDGIDAHGGVYETSQILYLRPELVKPEYKQAPAFWVGEGRDSGHEGPELAWLLGKPKTIHCRHW